MKRGFVGAFILLISFFMMSSSVIKKEEGIQFDQLTLAEAMELSNKNGKLIFIDCYTDWCGPCKRMAATSFKDKTVGDIYNKKFINLKIEMEKNPDGAEIARKYKIMGYPTLIIIDGDGQLKSKLVGMQSSTGLKEFAKSV